MTVWNTIDEKYSNVVLYIEMIPHVLIFCLFSKHFITGECHHIDDRCSNILVLLRTGKWPRRLYGEPLIGW